MKYTINDFIDFYADRDINSNKDWDERVCIDHREGKNEVDFLYEFTKVFPNIDHYDLMVDEHIGFIYCGDIYYFGKAFLEFCIEKELKDELAFRFYEHQLDESMGSKHGEYPSNETCYKTFDKYK